MRRRLHKDFWAGTAVALVGAAFAAQSARYRIGTLLQMGPGYFPAALGIIFALVGAAIAVQGFVKSPAESRERHPPDWRVWFLVIAAVVTFIVLGAQLGLAAAAFAIVFISALADRENTWASAALLALVMVVVSAIVFWWGLKLQFPLWLWGDA
jgi:hypothetical protein